MSKTLPNGDVVKTRIVRHRDGTISTKRQVIGKAAPSDPKPRPVLTPEQRAAREGTFLQRRPTPFRRVAPPPINIEDDAPKTVSAARRARKKAKLKAAEEPITAAPKTIKERTHHDKAGSLDKSAYVQTTNRIPQTLRRIKARTGSHIESFQKDYEMVASDLRSPNLTGAGGGGGVSLAGQMAKVQAIDRLKEFESQSFKSFKLCEAVLIYGETPSSLHKKGGPEHVICSHEIRNAIEDLAGFYTPAKRRPDKFLAAVVELVEEKKREASA